jgi:tetratricopeptide (TPR) repeat protein
MNCESEAIANLDWRILGYACHFYRRALRTYRQSKDTLAEGYCLRRLGEILLARSHVVRNHDPRCRVKTSVNYLKLTAIAGQLFESAASRYQRLRDDVGRSDCVVGLAATELEQSHVETARRLFEQSLDVFRSHTECESKQADCLVGLADVALRQCSSEEAMWLYCHADALYVQSNRNDGCGNCRLQLGDIAMERDKLGEANSHYKFAFSFYQKSSSLTGTMHALHGLGDIALRFEFFDEAVSHYARSLDLAKRCGLHFTMGLLNYKIGCCLAQKSHRAAYFKRASDIWHSIGRDDLVRQWIDDC